MRLGLEELEGLEADGPGEREVEQTHGSQEGALAAYFTQSTDHLGLGQLTAQDEFSAEVLEGVIRKRTAACGHDFISTGQASPPQA